MREQQLNAYWDDMDEAFPDWDGPTHSRALPSATTAMWRPPECRHWRDPVELLEEVTVFASAWFDRPAHQPIDPAWPDVGLYLDGSWSQIAMFCSPGFRPRFVRHQPERLVVYPWPDRGAPCEPRRFTRALRWVLAEATAGRRVEIGCAAAHGRTGTTLAGLLVLQGMSPSKAIKKIRREYCDEAVETRSQRETVERLARA